MFKNLLFKTLKSLSKEEKENLRKSLDDEKEEKVIEQMIEKVDEVKNENKEEGEEDMSKDLDKNEEIEVKEKETKTDMEQKKVEDTEQDNSNETKEKEEVVEEVEKQENVDPNIVEETEMEGNGISINDVVTKDVLRESLQAFEAKFDAILKENEDLKNKLAEMQDKYENKDFGTIKKQGVQEKNAHANESFDEYSRAFMPQ